MYTGGEGNEAWGWGEAGVRGGGGGGAGGTQNLTTACFGCQHTMLAPDAA